MKKLVILVSLLLIGCGDFVTGINPHQKLSFPTLPRDLHDCRFYKISNGEEVLRVVRCPNSTTSTQSGFTKFKKMVVVIDGDFTIKTEPTKE